MSVVVPAYNAADYLHDTLASVAAQTDGDWHCIIIDDGSTDSTAEIAQRFVDDDDRYRLVSWENQGVGAARNFGFALSDGEFLLFLDADDMLEPHAIESLKEALAKAPDAPAAHGRAVVVDRRGAPSVVEGYEQAYGRLRVRALDFPLFGVPRVEALPDSFPTGFDVMLLRNPISTPGQVLIRRSALEKVAGFDRRFGPAEDWAMWIGLCHLGPLTYLPRPVIRYRKHDAAMSAQPSQMRLAELRIRHRAIRSSHRLPNDGDRTVREAPSVEKLARLGLRSVEWVRALERGRMALRHVSQGELREAGRSLLRIGSSLLQIWLSFCGHRRWGRRSLRPSRFD